MISAALLHSKMRTVVPNADTRYTNLDSMGTCCSVTWMIVMLVVLLFSLIISFAPPTTLYRTSTSALTAGSTVLTHIAAFDHFSSLSSYQILWIRPIASYDVKTDLNFEVSSTIKYYGTGGIVDTDVINKTKFITKCKEKCDPVIIGENSWINFEQFSVTAQIKTSFAEVEGIEFISLTLYPFIAIAAFVIISVFTIVVAIFHFFCISRTLLPSRPDHWVTLLLGLFLFLVDGPWLILKYYTPRVASQLFDLMPELYHMVFLIAFTYFIAYRSIGSTNRIFSSWILKGSILAGLLILMVLQFVMTGLMPLSTLSIYIKTSKLRVPFSVIAIIFHVGIFALQIYGIHSLQIERFMVMIVAAVSFLVLEGIQITKLCIRIWVPISSAGSSFSADIFYIAMANMVTLYFLMINLPTSKTLISMEVGFEKDPDLKDPMLDSQQDYDQELASI